MEVSIAGRGWEKRGGAKRRVASVASYAALRAAPRQRLARIRFRVVAGFRAAEVGAGQGCETIGAGFRVAQVVAGARAAAVVAGFRAAKSFGVPYCDSSFAIFGHMGVAFWRFPSLEGRHAI